jgi:integrase/ribosomal protein L40E
MKKMGIKNQINAKHLERHKRQMDIEGLSERRKRDVCTRMRKIFNDYIPDKDFFKLSQEELENITLKLKDNLNSYYSIESYIQTMRRFIRIILELDSSESLPKKYRCIRVPRNNGKYKVFRGVEEIITPAQAFEYVKKAKNKRDAFIFMILLDAGLRPHELLKTKRRNLIRNELNYWYIQIPKDTKTGFRKVRLIFSIPFVEDYLKTLPKNQNNKLIDFSQERLVRIIKEIGKITPYILRHSSASFYASYLNEAELCERYGWVPGSKQVRTYVHLSQKQVDDKLNKVIRLNNGKGEPDDLEKLQPKFCLNCYSYSNYDSTHCRSCKQTLDPSEKLKQDKLDKVAYESAKELFKINPQRFEEIANGIGIELNY